MLEMEEGEVQRGRSRLKSEYTHTHSSRFFFFQQNPWKEPMTAGTEAAE